MTRTPSSTVIKVSGSLFDLPDLGERLGEFLASLCDDRILIVPGGGPTADAIRRLDDVHQLGEEASHWLALRALTVNAVFLERLVLLRALTLPARRADTIAVCQPDISFVDPYVFAREDERRSGHLPHVWQATSDAIAARVAVVKKAPALILLKSITIPSGISWETAAEKGYVDPIFPSIIRQAPQRITVTAINFRELSRMT